MARQYSHRQFFRQTSNDLLAQYFQMHHQVLTEIDFKKLKETEMDPILAAFNILPPDKQMEIEAQLQEMDAMACQGGITALTDEATDFHQDKTFPSNLGAIEGFHNKALWIFLNHYKYWQGGCYFLHSDNISETFWKKRNDLPRVKPNVETDNINLFGQCISQFFNSKEGRGLNCKVEVFRRYDKEYFFAYPEDFAQTSIVWVKNNLVNQAFRPAFEIIFAYSESEGSLDIYAPRNTKYVPELQEIFAKCILN